MGADPVTMGLIMGGIGAASSLTSSLATSGQQRSQAVQMAAKAQQERNQARLAIDQGEIKKRQIDLQRHEMARRYRNEQAHNNVLAGVGNVDSSSGSAMDVASGNATVYAGDVQENLYQRALTGWSAQEQAKQHAWQAEAYDANSSYLERTANNFAGTLLDTAIGGGMGFLQGYTMFGGKLFSEKGKKAANPWEWITTQNNAG